MKHRLSPVQLSPKQVVESNGIVLNPPVISYCVSKRPEGTYASLTLVILSGNQHFSFHYRGKK